MKRIIFIIVCWLIGTLYSAAQVDAHFTQYYMHPLFLNPGLTGVISDGDVRGAAIYRNQWSTISNPFSTISVTGDMLLNKGWGIGICLLNQSAGSGGYKNTNASISIANSNVRFGKAGYQHLSLGLQLGIISKRFDANKLQFGDQYSPALGFNPNSTSSALGYIQNLSQTLFDAAAGVVYFNESPDKKVNVYGGFSVAHLTQPTDNFSNTNTSLPMRYTVHGGARIIMSPTVSLYPNFIYMQQGNSNETVPGIHVEMKANSNTSVLLGSNFRINDAVNAFAGMYYKNFAVGISYDINTSSLNDLIKPVNSFELSLSYVFLRKQSINIEHFKCPRF
jgi:type IX secretion system PorP/SprF family membrane protein